uniref:Uncharacterized protein n=1 Tax=Meloidogyne enterolobii TaxID=390850 RepID=A0A6V7UYQ4_MELEN|nr:unnamed protein product [Meloidogyne enterolobii]
MAGTEAENWWKDEMRWEDDEEENEEYKQQQQTEEETINNDSGMESGDDEENCFESKNRRDSVTSECYSTTSCSSDTSSNF